MDALIVAKYVITRCYDNGNPVSNLKLQKMLYFIFGCYCAKFNDYLFDDEFIAWKLGPVISDVYYEYNRYVAEPICKSFDIELGLQNENKKFIDNEIDKLLTKTTWDLVEDSHKTTPWQKAYKRGKGTIIRKKQIADFFKEEVINE